ncbi:MAG: Mur ligase family protein [Chloroflexi bacterium]|nr:Mur ligase family protein [Chloroflexota bacterium]
MIAAIGKSWGQLVLHSKESALDYIFRTRRRLDDAPRGLDENTRDTATTRKLLRLANLPAAPCEFVVITGSRGKGSVASIMAKLLEALGYRVGLLTSPHLVHWNERIRVNGHMIPNDDFLRIIDDLRPHIDSVTVGLQERGYLSPQGIFLAMALQYFAEKRVEIAVLEVGRGGRFDDIAVVPNRLAVIAPILLEHTALLGDTLERIAWHKAGIIPSDGIALSAAQRSEAEAVLRREAGLQGARIRFLNEADRAKWLADVDDGQLIRLGPYGELLLPLLGRYQIENASLAIRAVEILQARLSASSLEDERYIESIRSGLTRVKWFGRVQKLDQEPPIYVDGAITVPSAESFIASVRPRLSEPVTAIVGVPRDRDFSGVYQVMARVSRKLIITETDINPNTTFPSREDALRAAQALHADATHTDSLRDALDLAREFAGESGTILLAVSLMLVGECMLIWNVDTSQI